MRVQAVLNVNTQQRNKSDTAQTGGNTFTVNATSGASFEDCLKSHYQQRDFQRKPRRPEPIADDKALDAAIPESALFDSGQPQIDILR